MKWSKSLTSQQFTIWNARVGAYDVALRRVTFASAAGVWWMVDVHGRDDVRFRKSWGVRYTEGRAKKKAEDFLVEKLNEQVRRAKSALEILTEQGRAAYWRGE